MSVLVVHNTHELHQLKKALPRHRGIMFLYRYYQSVKTSIIIGFLVAPVSLCGELAFLIAVF